MDFVDGNIAFIVVSKLGHTQSGSFHNNGNSENDQLEILRC